MLQADYQGAHEKRALHAIGGSGHCVTSSTRSADMQSDACILGLAELPLHHINVAVFRGHRTYDEMTMHEEQQGGICSGLIAPIAYS